MMEHYEDHHQGLLMPDQLKVSDQEASASKLFNAQLHMTDPLGLVITKDRCRPSRLEMAYPDGGHGILYYI